MKGLNLGTAVYSLVFSIFLLIAPLLTLTAIVGESVDESASGAANAVDTPIRVFAVIMVVLALILIIKDRVASKAGKILLIIAGAIVLLFSSLLGFPAGVVGIVGASLLLASNKRYKQ